MARRKNSTFGTLVVLGILALAAFGALTLWKMKPVQDTASSVERAAKAAKTAW